MADNKALLHAASSALSLVLVYINEEDDVPLGGASQWWLHNSLSSLSKSIDKLGSRLIIRTGKGVETAKQIVAEYDASLITWNRRYDSFGITADKELKAFFKAEGREALSFNSNLLHEPATMKTNSGGFFRVFTPFWKAYCRTETPNEPLPAPTLLPPSPGELKSITLNDLNLLPKSPDWAGGLRENWTPGEKGARKNLNAFLENAAFQYQDARDIPSVVATSFLSPHLRFGEISPREIWASAKASSQSVGPTNVDKFLSEIGWREFSHHLLFHNPNLSHENYASNFDAFPWQVDDALLTAWQKGKTGYPIVDAGMRQLYETGWMHNRVRMIAASFLIKHLLLDWREGEKWFWDTLVDACPAANPASWQWVAGSGADAAPYFRIFNPILQGEKFDKDGAYVKRWCPELKKVPNKFIHKPWTLGEAELAACGVTLGEHYPKPVVDHSFARDRALAAYKVMKDQAA